MLHIALAVALATTQPSRIVSTIAGTPGVAGFQDGDAMRAAFNKPTWIDIALQTNSYGVNAGDIFVVDRVNNAVRRVGGGFVSTAVVRRNWYDVKSETVGFNFGGPFGGGIVLEGNGGGCGAGPWDAGAFVASSGSHQIYVIAPLSNQAALAARDEGLPILGASNAPGAVDGEQQVVRFNTPTGLARSPTYTWATIPQRSVYVTDSGNHTVRRIGFRWGGEGCPIPSLTTLAGAAGQPGTSDGVGSAARFNSPHGVAVAANGDVYVADSGNHTIRRISPNGQVTTVAGVAGESGTDDNHLNTPTGIDIDAAGNLFIADTGNHAIRELTAGGRLITIAGTSGVPGYADGDALQARFNGPVGLKIAADGALIVADTSNHVIRRVYAVVTLPRHHAVPH